MRAVVTSCYNYDCSILYTEQKMIKNFRLRICPVNVTKFAVSCGFGHIYRRNP